MEQHPQMLLIQMVCKDRIIHGPNISKLVINLDSWANTLYDTSGVRQDPEPVPNLSYDYQTVQNIQ